MESAGSSGPPVFAVSADRFDSVDAVISETSAEGFWQLVRVQGKKPTTRVLRMKIAFCFTNSIVKIFFGLMAEPEKPDCGERQEADCGGRCKAHPIVDDEKHGRKEKRRLCGGFVLTILCKAITFLSVKRPCDA